MEMYTNRWQCQVTSIPDGFCKLHQTKEFADVTLKINKQDPYKAHKLVLAAKSPVFKALLLDSEHVSEELVIEDESLTVVGCEILFRFIYTNQMGTQDKKSIIKAYLTAKYFKQVELMAECLQNITTWTITNEDNDDNVWLLLDAGYTIDLLRDKCLAVIKNDVRGALSCSSFLKISCGCIDCLLESGLLKDVSVMECFQRIMEWAAKRHTQPVDYNLVRQTFDEQRLGKLRLEELNTKDLNEIMSNYKGLLTTSEAMQFFKHSGDSKAALPDWCVPSS